MTSEPYDCPTVHPYIYILSYLDDSHLTSILANRNYIPLFGGNKERRNKKKKRSTYHPEIQVIAIKFLSTCLCLSFLNAHVTSTIKILFNHAEKEKPWGALWFRNDALSRIRKIAFNMFSLICYLEICEGLCINALIGIWMKTDER